MASLEKSKAGSAAPSGPSGPSGSSVVIPTMETVGVDVLYKYDEALHKRICQQKPWKTDPHYFKDVKICASALIKMVMHARSGGSIEVMGMIVGKVIEGGTMVVTDAFALPVEGTETRVNAGNEAMEYMVQYMEHMKQVGRKENAIGWYHSHPGYGCWLSGIDVSTQMLNQQFQEPWLAIVIDPVQTMATGRLYLGAFRTYPKDYTPPASSGSDLYQSIPLAKIEDFGVHAKMYYELPVSYFNSSLDTKLLNFLWNKYWVSTLSSSPLQANQEFTAGQVSDVAAKMFSMDLSAFRKSLVPSETGSSSSSSSSSSTPSAAGHTAPMHPLVRLNKDCCKIGEGILCSQMAEIVKHLVFRLAAAKE